MKLSIQIPSILAMYELSIQKTGFLFLSITIEYDIRMLLKAGVSSLNIT
jgi:hypothetical protein